MDEKPRKTIRQWVGDSDDPCFPCNIWEADLYFIRRREEAGARFRARAHIIRAKLEGKREYVKRTGESLPSYIATLKFFDDEDSYRR